MRSTVSGPVFVIGNTNPTQAQDTDVGPSLLFQGQGLLDVRLVGTIDAAPSRPVPGFYNSEMVSLIDATPSASAAANLYTFAGATVVPAGGATTPTVVTPTQSIAVSTNVPLEVFPPGPAGTIATAPATLDFGFTTGSITAGQSTLTVPAGAYKFFKKGQVLLMPGAGSGGTAPMLNVVAATPAFGATTISLLSNAITTTTSQPVGTADPSLYNMANPSLTPTLSNVGALPMIFAGATALWDPTQLVSRCLRVVNNNAGDTGYSVTVRGWDVYGNPMTENIPVTANGTAYGKKAWKYVNTVSLLKTGGGTTTGTVTIGTGDTFGIPMRSDFFEYMSIYYNGAFVATNGSSNPLWVAADTTNPALTTSGDVRGTIQCGANGGGSSSATSPNGTIRLAAFMSVPAYNAVNATNLNYASLFGVSQNNS